MIGLVTIGHPMGHQLPLPTRFWSLCVATSCIPRTYKERYHHLPTVIWTRCVSWIADAFSGRLKGHISVHRRSPLEVWDNINVSSYFFLLMYILLYLLSSGSFRVKSISFLDACIQRKYIFVLFQNDGGKISMNDDIVFLLLIHRKLEILINKGLIRYSMYVEHLSQLSRITRGLPIVCKEKFVV